MQQVLKAQLVQLEQLVQLVQPVKQVQWAQLVQPAQKDQLVLNIQFFLFLLRGNLQTPMMILFLGI